VIEKVRKATLLKIKELEEKLMKVDEKIVEEQTSLQKERYNLHAILVHTGDGDQGHYYAFIYDRKCQKWYRFNDYKITEEDESVVFNES
jgi:ubiquitin C-terminal hydrolase